MPSGAFTGNLSCTNPKDAVHKFKFVNCSSVFNKANKMAELYPVTFLLLLIGAYGRVDYLGHFAPITSRQSFKVLYDVMMNSYQGE